jgi:hypothetical protein|tara:strand:+ start:339 stop:506 length:168 start_codon:yes stop_codon:yes gene_type:complete
MLPARKGLGAFLFFLGMGICGLGLFFGPFLLIALLLGLPLMMVGGMMCAKGCLDL